MRTIMVNGIPGSSSIMLKNIVHAWVLSHSKSVLICTSTLNLSQVAQLFCFLSVSLFSLPRLLGVGHVLLASSSHLVCCNLFPSVFLVDH